MVTPELPTRIPIGHPIFDHDPDRQGHDPMRVMTTRRGHIRQVGAEVLITGFTVVLRIRNVQLAGSSRRQVTDIVQRSSEHMLAGRGLAAPRTRALRFNARLFGNLGFGQVFDAGEGHVWHILARAQFAGGDGGRFLHAPSLPQIACRGIFSTVAMLQCRIFRHFIGT
jgi:hypothetical protein